MSPSGTNATARAASGRFLSPLALKSPAWLRFLYLLRSYAIPLLTGTALIAIASGGAFRAPLAYICGSLGVLVGADLLRLKEVRQRGLPWPRSAVRELSMASS